MPTYQYVTVSINIKKITGTGEAGTVKFYSYEPISLSTGEVIPPNPTASGGATVTLDANGLANPGPSLASNTENPGGLGYGSSYTVKYVGVADSSERLLGTIVIPATASSQALEDLLTSGLPVVPAYIAAQYVDIPSNQTITGIKTFNATPVFGSGASFTAGKLSTAASVTGTAGLRLPHGTAPTSPANGDMWTTTGGLFAQINGSTVQFNTSAASVTSVGLLMPSIFSVSNSPVTSAGTLTASLVNQTANTVFAAPNGSSGAPSFRSLVGADVPVATGSTQGTVITGSNITNSSGTISITGTNVTNALTYTPVNKAGDTMSGTLVLSGNPVNGNDAANKTYVDAVAQGFDQKASCRAISTSNITLSGTQTVDGVALISGDRILVAGQTTGADNGIYVVASGAWSRAADADTSAKVTTGLFTFIEEGTTNASSGWSLITAAPITLGTTALSFTQTSGAGQITAGTGLSKSGNTLNNTGVLSNVAGTGISVSGATGNVTITNSGVTSLAAGTGISVSSATGGVTISATNSGTVTSVGLSLPTEFSVTNSPVTSTGTLTGAWATQTTNKVFAAPSGSTGTPTFRALVSADLPLGTTGAAGALQVGSNLSVSSGTISLASGGVTGALGFTPADKAGDTFTGKVNTPASASGGAGLNVGQGTAPTSPVNGDFWITSSGVFAYSNGGTLQLGGSGSGTVTSVGLSLPSIFTVSGSPVTSSGTLSATLANQTANYVFAAPNGVTSTPSFRALVGADVPVAAGAVQGTVIVGSNITNTSGTISLTGANVNSALGYTAVNQAGDTFTGKVTTVASATGGAGFNLPHGAAPTTPTNGDVWTTTTSMYARINGATIDLAASTGPVIQSITSLGTNHTMIANEVALVKITAAATANIVLPASAAANTMVYIKDGSGNFATYPVTVVPSGTDTIEGDTSMVLRVNRVSVSLISDGSGKWYIL